LVLKYTNYAKHCPLFLAFAAIFFVGAFINGSKPKLPVKAFKPEGSTVEHKPVTLDMLNCKPGLYKTYQDFLDGKPLKYQYIEIDFKTKESGRLVKYNAVFKDEKGKTVELDPKDFWGFTDHNRHLCRSGAYNHNTDVPLICYYVEYATNGFISYITCNTYGDYRFPYYWFSLDLNSPVIDGPSFWNAHGKYLTKKVDDEIKNCERHSKPDKDLRVWANRVYECYGEIPGFIGKWVKDNVRSTNSDDPSSYVK
jgi:hypothetical protein